MFSFNQNILRRFKIGDSVGPCFSNTNSICQGCPLAILRINALIAAWVNVVHSHPSIPSCRTGAFIDDRNLRTTSHSILQDCIRITQQFDTAVGAIINQNKTHVFGTTAQARKQLASGSFGVVADDKLLGAHLSFTRRRSRKLANERAAASCIVAKRITMCPLNTQAREVLLSTSMAPKFTFGLELGSCDVKIERSFRSIVSRALWSKGNHKCNNMLFTLCHKGHLFDPSQLKIYIPFKICRRQLVKHPSLQPQWRHIWEQSSELRNNYKDGRSNTIGPLSTLLHMSKLIGWDWTEPFVFTWRFSQNQILSIPFLNIPEAYFNHLVRLSINRMLWSKASTSRKNLRGVHVGIDKSSTIKFLNSPVLSPYDKGILRAILADGIVTQKYLFSTKQAQHPVCRFCWQEVESLEHLFWHWEAWNSIRCSHLTEQQIRQCQQLPLPTQRAGIFISTNEQSNQFVLSHQQILNGNRPLSLPLHDCTFIQQIQHTMVDIIKARNQTDPSDPPDDFDFSPFLPNRPVPASSEPCQAPSQPGDVEFDDKATAAKLNKPTHSPEGFLLSTSTRPGSSKYQFVAYNAKTSKFRVCIPYQGKRHCWGPFDSDIEAAKRVKQFYEELDQGIQPPTRGEKRTIAFHNDLDVKLRKLNATAFSEKRHEVYDTENPTCCHCNKSVHTYHALKFATQLCHMLTNSVDKQGSATRGRKLSEHRTAILQKEIDKHNLVAIRRCQHFISSIDPPTCKHCLQTVSRNYIKRWMVRQCACAPDPNAIIDGANITKRLTGKQPAPPLCLPSDAS